MRRMVKPRAFATALNSKLSLKREIDAGVYIVSTYNFQSAEK